MFAYTRLESVGYVLEHIIRAVAGSLKVIRQHCVVIPATTFA